jgi:hypothetical protein
MVTGMFYSQARLPRQQRADPGFPPAPPRVALVISADPAVRGDWARFFEAMGMKTLRCVGPQVLCVLLDGGRCPLHEEADLAIYDRATVTPELTLRLIRDSHDLPIAFARDRLSEEGRHEPVITSVASDGAGDCIGSRVATRGR